MSFQRQLEYLRIDFKSRKNKQKNPPGFNFQEKKMYPGSLWLTEPSINLLSIVPVSGMSVCLWNYHKLDPQNIKVKLCSPIPHLNAGGKRRRKHYDVPSFPKLFGLDHGMVMAEHEHVISVELIHFLSGTMHLYIGIRYNQTSIFDFAQTSSNLILSALKNVS